MNEPHQPQKKNRWMIIIGIVIVVSLIGIGFSYLIGQKNADNRNGVNPTASPADTVTNQNQQTTSRDNRSPQPADTSGIDVGLLTAPVPQDESVAKEEVSRLQDEQAQLAERKDNLEQQLKDSDKLVELKEKYLADLQAELNKTSA